MCAFGWVEKNVNVPAVNPHCALSWPPHGDQLIEKGEVLLDEV
jgi:hypothetical protein